MSTVSRESWIRPRTDLPRIDGGAGGSGANGDFLAAVFQFRKPGIGDSVEFRQHPAKARPLLTSRPSSRTLASGASMSTSCKLFDAVQSAWWRTWGELWPKGLINEGY